MRSQRTTKRTSRTLTIEPTWAYLKARFDNAVPGKKAMALYFNQGKGGRGRPITTLPVVLRAEAKKIMGKPPTLQALNDLAKDRRGCWKFSNKVIAKSYGGSAKKVAYASNGVKRTWLRMG